MKIFRTFVSHKSPYSPMDIGSKCKYPLDVLSNFTETNLEYDGVAIRSIEGFLQALKTPDIDTQKEICSLVGYAAKKAGNKLKKKNIYDGEHLYWQGRTFSRHSEEYQKLLKRIYALKYSEDINFRNALNKTGNHVLTHSIGKDNPSQTVLTTNEFISLLLSLRNTKPVRFIDKMKLMFKRITNNIKRTWTNNYNKVTQAILINS